MAIGLALAGALIVPAQAAKNSAPAQVMMLATMPPAFSMQAAQAIITGAAGSVLLQGNGRGRLLIRAQLRGHGGKAVVRIPVSLAANTRSFVVQTLAQSGSSNASIYLAAPGIISRRMPMRGQTSLAMGLAANHGREFFTLSRPLHSTLEIVFEDLPSTHPSNFSLTLSMRDLGY